MAAKQVDEESTHRLISAFSTAGEDVQRFDRQASAISGAVQWLGGASTDFRVGIGEWQQGLRKVGDALAKIQDDIAYYGTLTADTEDAIRGTLRSGLEANGSWAG